MSASEPTLPKQTPLLDTLTMRFCQAIPTCVMTCHLSCLRDNLTDSHELDRQTRNALSTPTEAGRTLGMAES